MLTETPSALRHLLRGTPYRAVSPLGSGGMGEIYEAIGPVRGAPVAVKLLRAALAGTADYEERMRIEGETIEQLRHRHVVRGCDHGVTADGRAYVAMERLYGHTLREELRQRGALPLAEAIRHTMQLLSALRAVHEIGLVHRDVKPDNVMLCDMGGGMKGIKLLDFGIAKVMPVVRAVRSRVMPIALPTLEGVCVGTPRYISPEQAQGQEVDPRADVYATGILLYTLVAGRGPFDEIQGAGGLLRAHQELTPHPPSHFAPAPVPREIDEIVLRAIAKNPAQRFEDALSFSRALWAVVARLRPVTIPKTWKPPRAREVTPTVRAPRFDERPTVVYRPDELALLAGRSEPRIVRPPRPPERRLGARAKGSKARPPVVSRAEVILSAAAFGAAAGMLGMWFVR